MVLIGRNTTLKVFFVLSFLFVFCSSSFAKGRISVIDHGVFEIPSNREWKEHYVEAGTNDYTGFSLVGREEGYDPKSKIAIGYFISDEGSTESCTDPIFGSIDDSRDACYQYVQISFRVIENIGYVRLDRVCVNPTSNGKTVPSLIRNKIKWFLIQKSP